MKYRISVEVSFDVDMAEGDPKQVGGQARDALRAMISHPDYLQGTTLNVWRAMVVDNIAIFAQRARREDGRSYIWGEI